jgi:hypothetical protein
MKRIVWALPVMAAMVLFCFSAFGGDVLAAQSSTILPEPPDPVETHWILGLFLVVNAAVRTGLSSDTVKLPTKAAPWRTAIVAILSALGAFLEGLQNGFALKSVVLTFLMLNLPTIVQEVLKVVFGAGPSAGSGTGAPGGTGIRPPPGYSQPMSADAGFVFAKEGRPYFTSAAVGLAIGFCALALSGCAAKGMVCPIIETAAELCPYLVVRLPDGSTETVPREAIMGVAQQARAMRTAGAKASDAGLDQ